VKVPPPHEDWHLLLAWAYVVAVVGFVITALIIFVRADRARRSEPDKCAGVREPDTADTEDDIYQRAEPYAYRIKAILQMIIAVVAVCVVGWQFLHVWPKGAGQPTNLLLNGIGVGLAASAVVELAYTLFTAGPDEALDPLMLGLSATILIELGRPDPLTAGRAAALLLLGVLLAVLFTVRLFLAENHHSKHPQVWWIGRRSRRSGNRVGIRRRRSAGGGGHGRA